MSWTVHGSDATRHLLLRASGGERLPEGLAARLQEDGVTCGWVRASGVLAEVELRAYDGELSGLGSTRRIAGPVQVVLLEGSVGLHEGEVSVGMRALVARETDRGLETLAGEIASARVVALEALVTVLDDVSVARALDQGAGVWMLAGGAPGPRPAAHRPPAAPPAWSSALAASETVEDEGPLRRAPSPPGQGAPMPQRPARPELDLDTLAPEAGDAVEHFAFGRADVLKSDGDRLHLKVHKDGRIREIALEMLKVARLPDGEGGKRRFRLERRL